LKVLLALVLCQARGDDLAKYIRTDPGSDARHATGFVRDDPARYQSTTAVPRFRAFYPAQWDLSADLPPPGDQGKQGSCVAWAVGYAARTYYLKHDYSVDVTDATNILSPAYIFNSLRTTRGDCSQGTSIADALKLLKASGGVPLESLPYDPTQCFALPSPDVLAQYSNRFRITGYKRVDGQNEDDVKGQLYNGNPVIFGINVPSDFDYYRSGVIDTTQGGGPGNGHAMVIVGYDDARQAYHFVNSWGPRWGEHGFGWLSYRAASALWLEGYVMQVAAPPAPPPEPAPPQPMPTPVVPVVAPKLDLTAACSRLNAIAVQDDRGFAFKLTGFVGQSEDLERIRQGALRQAGVSGLDTTDVLLRPWPQCETLLTLDAALRNGHGISLTQTPDQQRLIKGEHMVFEVRSPDYPSYLYVAYVQADGTAANLLRPTGSGPTAPNTTVRLGEGPHSVHFRVGPPYGHEMVVALASDQPLFGESLPIRDRQLLTAYRRVVPRAQVVSAAIVTLETAEQ
jgi:hypothetical protein